VTPTRFLTNIDINTNANNNNNNGWQSHFSFGENIMKPLTHQRTALVPSIAQKLLPLAVAGACSISALANDHFGLEEIIVTAQKRAERVQDVPISISAMSSDFVRDVGAQTVDGLGIFTPGLETRVSEVTTPQLSIRGITTNDFGIGADPAVAVYVDGVYSGRSGAALTAFQDIERVEVLKGPQGTLFGKNAAAGAIHVISKKPVQEFEAELNASLGNYGKRKFEAMINQPLSDDFALRVNLMDNQRDGYRKNRFNGEQLSDENSGGARASLAWAATDNTQVLAQIDYYNVDQGGAVYSSFLLGDAYGDVQLDFTPKETLELWGGAVTVDSDFDSLLFTSITAIKRFETNNFVDYDGTDLFTTLGSAAPIYLVTGNVEENTFFSQEFRLSFDKGDELRWTLGAMYSREHGKQEAHTVIPTDVVNSVLIGLGVPVEGLLPFGLLFPEMASGDLVSTSAALYGDMTYALNDGLDLTVGLRYTQDEKGYELTTLYNPFGLGGIFPNEANGLEQDDSWSNLSSRVVLDYKFGEDAMVYLSYATGYKAGGFNTTQPARPFDEEQVSNVELGLKSTWLDSRLRFNAAVYSYEYEDLQEYDSVRDPVSGLVRQEIRNLDAEGQGFEMDLTWAATERLELNANYDYLDTEITDYTLVPGETAADDRKGQPLSRAAEGSYNLGAQYTLPLNSAGEVLFRLDYSYVGEREVTAIVAATPVAQALIDQNIGDLEGDYENVNARMTYMNADGDWRVSLWGQNLTDEEYLYHIDDGAAGIGSASARRASPRFYGLDVGYSF
jgi:iron complex outermembrane recepter protein